MKTKEKTKDQLLKELAQLQQQNAELVTLKATDDDQVLMALANNSTIGIYIVQDGKFCFINSTFQKYMGHNETELLGMDSLNFVYPEDRGMVRENAVKMLKGESSSPYEFRYMNKGGECLWVMESVTPIQYQGKQATLGSFIDTTQRKQIEEKYRHLLDDMSDGYGVIQEEKFVFANRRLEEILGYQPGQLLGNSFIHFVTPDSRQSVTELYEKMMRGEESIPERHQRIALKRDRTSIIVNLGIKIIEYNNKPAAYIIVRDITEHKRTEEQIDHRLKIEEAITIISRLFASQIDVDLNEVIKTLSKVVTVNRAYIFQFSQDGEKVNNTHEWCAPGTKPQIENFQDIDCALIPWWMKMLHAGENIVIADSDSLPAEAKYERKLIQSEEICSLLAVPISATGGRLAGFMGFNDTKEYRQWSDEDVSILRVVAEMLANYWERKQAEDKYRQLLEDMSDGYVVIQDRKYVFVNKRFAEIFGYETEELIGTSIGELASHDNRPEINERYENLIRGEEPYINQYETMGTRKDGTIIATETSIKPIQYEGKPGFCCLVRDITERSRMQDQLAESEQKYRLLADNVLDVIWSMDMNLNLTYSSPSVIKLRGYEVEEALSQTLQDILTPDSLEIAMEALSRGLSQAHSDDNDPNGPAYIENMELEMKCKDGSTILTETTASLMLDKDGIAVGIIGISRDITERKQAEATLRESEEKLRLIFESVPEGIFVCDLNGMILDVNETVVHMHGYDTKEELVGRNCIELIVEREHIKFRKYAKKTLKTGYLRIIRYTLMKKDGSEFPAAASAAVLRDAKDNPKGFVIITTDVTEQRKIQEQLMLADRLASIGQLAAGIAHELNNPLAGVVGISKLLLEKDVPDKVKSDLEIIDKEATRAANVVRGLLTFARGKGTEKVLMDINTVIQEVLQLRSYEQRVSNIEVETEFATDLPHINVSGAQMEQVFINIVVNAEQAMLGAKKEGKLRVKTEKVGDNIKISIADDGPGISPKNMKKLFSPFFTTKDVGKGTGLGLSICHGIIAEHGGRIYVESELGKGACFIIELPIEANEEGSKDMENY